MEAVAKARYVRCSARKMRQVSDMIRGKRVDQCLSSLFVLKQNKKSAAIIDKILKAAVANFKEKNLDKVIDADSLFIKAISVDEGPKIKRIRPRAQGRAFSIHKKQCHLTLLLTD